MSVLEKLKNLLGKIIVVLAAVGMAAITIIIFAQVIYRYALGHSLSWAEEVSLYLEVWIVFLVSGYALGTGQHICMDIISSRVPKTMHVILQKIVSLISVIYSVACSVYGWQYMLAEQGQRMASLLIGKWAVYLGLFVGSVIMIFYSIVLLLEPSVTDDSGSGEEEKISC